MASKNQNPQAYKSEQDDSQDDTDADAFAILSAVFIAYAAIVYFLTH